MSKVEQYRKAARRIWGLTKKEAASCIYHPRNDPGEWAPKSLAVINLEMGLLPWCDYYHPEGLDNCVRLSQEADGGVTYVEWVNAAIAAVYT